MVKLVELNVRTIGPAVKILQMFEECAYSVADPGFSPGGCANSQNCYYFSNFCQKLHENERIWTPRRGRASLAPPLRSANVICRCASVVVYFLLGLSLQLGFSYFEFKMRLIRLGLSFQK